MKEIIDFLQSLGQNNINMRGQWNSNSKSIVVREAGASLTETVFGNPTIGCATVCEGEKRHRFEIIEICCEDEGFNRDIVTRYYGQDKYKQTNVIHCKKKDAVMNRQGFRDSSNTVKMFLSGA